jgi:DNA-binding Lrp family transcriptional regulator
MVESTSWMGEEATREALRLIPELEEAHIIAGSASLLVKIRTATTAELQDVLRRIYTIDGVSGTQTIVVLDTVFEAAGGPSGGPPANES